MAYTIEQAKLELKNLTSNSTLDDIRNIINNLDVTDIKASKDAKTVLFLVPNVHVGNAYKN